jgi:hypothetical protein
MTSARQRYAAGAALVLAIVTTGEATACSSAAPRTHSRSSTAPASGGGRPGYVGQTGMMPLAECLAAHGASLQRVAALFGLAASPDSAQVSNAVLRSAGQACTRYAGNLEPVFQQIDNCVAVHGAATAHTGSALTDLLLLDPTQPRDARAISACQQQAQNAAGG